MLVQPSSLIFLVIIGIWAAYFVQYWVRRREHLATIRSVDAFSETMRVLERRAPLPSVDTGSLGPRTYAVSPTRAMRPQVTVKRAEPHALTRDRVAAALQSTAPHSASTSTAPSRGGARPTRDIKPEVATMHPSRATRGIVLLVGLVGTVVFGVLAATGVLVIWSPLAPFAMAVAGFVWLRAGVQGEIRARHDARRDGARREGARRAAPVARRPEQGLAGSPSRPAAPLAEHEVEAPFDVSSSPAAPAQPAGAEPFLADPFAPETVPAEATSMEPVAEHEVALPEVDEDDIPLTWDPRPVPRPTYTMKARAPQRPAPQADAGGEAEQTAYDELPERRISGL